MGSFPSRLHEQLMNIRERLNAPFDHRFEPIGRLGLSKMHSRLYRRQNVFGSVLRLACEQRDLRLTAFTFGNVTGDLRRADDLTLKVSNRRDGQRNIYQAPMLALTNGLIVIDALTASDALKDGVLFCVIF